MIGAEAWPPRYTASLYASYMGFDFAGARWLGRLSFGLPRLRRAERETSEERVRADNLQSSQQALEVEAAGLRSASSRVRELEEQANITQTTIVDLNQRLGSCTASNAGKDSALDDLQRRYDALELDADAKADKMTKLEVERGELISKMTEREKALDSERERFNRSVKGEFAQLSAEALRENRQAFFSTAKQEVSLQQGAATSELLSQKERNQNFGRADY